MMVDAKAPLRHWAEIAVYAPIGLFVLVQKELPKLVESGRTRVDNQVTLARFAAKVAVSQGRAELARRLEAAEADRRRRRSDVIVDAHSTEAGDEYIAASVPTGPAPAPAPTVTPTAATTPGSLPVEHAESLPEAILAAVADAPVLATESADAALPIEGYDSLAASQVVSRLATFTGDELEDIRRHEESHRARRTILGKISQLQAR